MDQAMLLVWIFPFPIIYWFWSLMAELRRSFSHSCESLLLWGMVMSNTHKWMQHGEILAVPPPEACRSPSGALLPQRTLGERWGWGCSQSTGNGACGDLAGLDGALPLQQRMRLHNYMLVRLLICPFQVLLCYSPFHCWFIPTLKY